MKTTVLITLIFLSVGCATVPKTFSSFSDWDSNKDQNIDRREFVKGYITQDYFNKWSARGYSISYPKFFEETFTTVDWDKNAKLSKAEFDFMVKKFYFGMSTDQFNDWDVDSSGSISYDEFDKRIVDTSLASLWDSNSDKQLENREIAGGMFYLCDKDNNGIVTEIELDTWKSTR
jgi:Ca2+-binding EF-hand superfamily protein